MCLYAWYVEYSDLVSMDSPHCALYRPSIDSIDYAGIGNAPSHMQTLLIMPYGVMEKMESTSIPALFQPIQWFYCGKPAQ